MIRPSCTTTMSCKLIKAHLLRVVKGDSRYASTTSYKASKPPSCVAMKRDCTAPSTNHMQRSGCDYLLHELKPTGALGFQGLLWSHWLFWKVFSKTVTGISVTESMQSSPTSLAWGTIAAKSPWHTYKRLWNNIHLLRTLPFHPIRTSSPPRIVLLCSWST